MSKIDRSGPGPSKPIDTTQPAENVKETAATNEAAGPKSNSAAAESTTTVSKQVTADKNAAADLRASGTFLKSELLKELNTKKAVDPDKEKEMALRVAQNMQRFAPPYVPVGPVVMGDNISVPAQSANNQLNELNLRADQFQINDQGNLVITNEKLIQFFKSLQQSQGGQDIRLGIMKMKPSGEE